MRTSLSDVVIEVIDVRALTDAEIAEANDFNNACRAESHPEDPPTPLDIAMTAMRAIPEHVVINEFWARSDGRLIGSGQAVWFTAEENAHLAQVGLNVLAEHRRRGIATELLSRVVEVVDRAGRTMLMGTSTERVPDGGAFAERVGAEVAIRTHTNRLLLSDVDPEMIDRWVAEGPGRAPGYSLVTIDGAYPDDLIEAILDLGEVMNTAPRDDLDMEDWHVTVEEARAGEAQFFAVGGERWYIAARHDASGVLAGFTELFYNRREDARIGWQGGTGVRPEHRGHALGKWLKAANLRRVLDEWTDIVEIRTGNSDSNDAMLGINKALGFKPYYSETGWQIPVAKVKAYLDAR